MPVLADKYNCSGCLSCVDSCPTGALFSRWNEEGHLSYGIDNDLCVECHKCEKNCPAINGFQYGVNNLNLSTPYAVWANDVELRRKSTSGGVFAAIAKKVLESGGVVFGAAMLGNEVKHIGIEKIEELYLLQGSKYAQSDTTGIYKLVLDALKKDKFVLFSGLGCQVAGLLNFLPHNKVFDKLYTIDLICGGVPSRSLITKFIEHEDVKSIHSFRNKSVYEFSVINKEDKIEVVPLSKRPLPLCGFYTELTNKYICYDCRYLGAHRKSDITIGDYWGDTEFPDEHKNGLSVAVVHSSIGRTLLESADIFSKQIKWDTFLLNNHRMVYGCNEKASSKRRKQLADSIKNDSYSEFVIKYANGATIKTPYWLIIKIFRYLYGRIRPNKKDAFVKKILKNNR